MYLFDMNLCIAYRILPVAYSLLSIPYSLLPSRRGAVAQPLCNTHPRLSPASSRSP